MDAVGIRSRMESVCTWRQHAAIDYETTLLASVVAAVGIVQLILYECFVFWTLHIASDICARHQ